MQEKGVLVKDTMAIKKEAYVQRQMHIMPTVGALPHYRTKTHTNTRARVPAVAGD